MTPSRKSAPSKGKMDYESVRGAEQIALLANPLRQDLVDTLQALGGEASVAAVAAELGRAADGLYYHFDLLADAGILHRLVDAQGVRRYRLGSRGKPGRALRLDYGKDAASAAAVGRVVDGLITTAQRDFHAALALPGTVTDGSARELWAGRSRGWVNDRQLAEANRLLQRLQDLLQGPRRPGQDRLVSLSFVLAPLAPQSKRRQPGQ